jgi:hypothetical protein
MTHSRNTGREAQVELDEKRQGGAVPGHAGRYVTAGDDASRDRSRSIIGGIRGANWNHPKSERQYVGWAVFRHVDHELRTETGDPLARIGGRGTILVIGRAVAAGSFGVGGCASHSVSGRIIDRHGSRTDNRAS